MTDGQPELFQMAMVGDREVVRGPSLPEPPSGPAASVPSPKAGTLDAYWTWRRTEEGKAAWGWISQQARTLLGAGEKRVAIGMLMADCRHGQKLAVDQRYGPYLTDELCERWPEFLEVIERRRRKKA